MGKPYTRKKIVLTQTNAQATNVSVSLTSDAEAGSLVDFLAAKLESGGDKTVHCQLRTGSIRIGLLAPVSGLEVGNNEVVTLVPSQAVNGELDTNQRSAVGQKRATARRRRHFHSRGQLRAE